MRDGYRTRAGYTQEATDDYVRLLNRKNREEVLPSRAQTDFGTTKKIIPNEGENPYTV